MQIAFLKGAKVEVDLMRLMLRRLTLTGSTLRIQSTEAKARMAKAIEQRIWPLVAAGKLKPMIDFDLFAERGGESAPPIDAPDHIGKSCWWRGRDRPSRRASALSGYEDAVPMARSGARLDAMNPNFPPPRQSTIAYMGITPYIGHSPSFDFGLLFRRRERRPRPTNLRFETNMDRTPLMPKATAVWLVENTSLSFEQIAEFCGLHVLEVKGIADGDVAQGIKGMDPISNGQLTREEIARAEEDHEHRLQARRGARSTSPRSRPRRARATRRCRAARTGPTPCSGCCATIPS